MARTRTFCCCLPARWGVFILTVLNLVGGQLIAVLGWIQVTKLKATRFTTRNEIALVLHSIMFSILAAVSLLGLIGATIKHRSLVSVFGMMLLVFLFISVGIGIYTMYSLFRNHGQALVQACIKTHGNLSRDTCTVVAELMQVILVMAYTLVWFLQIWGVMVVVRYCHQLDDEEEETLMERIKTSMIGESDIRSMMAPPNDRVLNHSRV